ncbi:unnamed protein product [Trifolium pratense]|uniref:Uncharacterized protein n=1 Tax=Trifolium pratense TaxID=57577 RepID=A0ACB0ILU4_TRIPR|nr:unnamed protein product [Trifolium pratense]
MFHDSNLCISTIQTSSGMIVDAKFRKGKKATAFPAMCSKLSDQSEVENRVVVDGTLCTISYRLRCLGTSIEFALVIVQKLFGRNLALELAKTTVFTSP